MSETVLRTHLTAAGATYVEDRGVWLPRHFGDPAREYRALRESAALVDLGFRTVVAATGEDRAAFLQGMLTNDVAALGAGTGCAALLLTIQGRVVADVRVVATGDALLLVVDRRVRDAFTGALEKLIIADDVTLAEPADATVLLGVEGPRAADMIEAGPLAPYAHTMVRIAGTDVRTQRASELAGPGLVLHVPAAAGARVWDALVGAGAVPCGMEALEARRVEVGVPRVGLDMDEQVLALEVPVDAAISSTKGCYLGQEVIARGTARGHVNRRLVGIVLDGPVPPRGTALVRDGKEAGRLTTVVHAYGLGKAAALAFVRREHWDPGTELAVPHGHAVSIARVTALPLA